MDYGYDIDYREDRFCVSGDSGGRFVLRRVAFPENPPPEWFVIGLLEHAAQAGASRGDLSASLAKAVARGAYSRERLLEMSERYATKATRALVVFSVSAA
jgi:hypothetical protein